jgi:putative glutamine amidotransferase
MKPIIGITPLWDDEKQSYWMLPGYMDGIVQAGGLPIMLSFTKDIEQYIDLCDGFLFTGGHDIDPKWYGQERLNDSIVPCWQRDALEMPLFEQAMKKDKPILGICRGIQLINVALGGTLYQDLPTQKRSSIHHHMDHPYDTTNHDVRIVPNRPLYDLLHTTCLSVNSIHHQGIRRIAPSLQVMAEAMDGLVEAVYKPDQTFLWGIQWHPEYLYPKDENSQKIFQCFVNSIV